MNSDMNCNMSSDMNSNVNSNVNSREYFCVNWTKNVHVLCV